MLKKIEELRKRPKHVRDRYAFVSALVFTSAVAMIWVVSLPARFSETPEVGLADDQNGSFSRALEDVQGQMANVFGGLGEELNSLQEESAAISDTDLGNPSNEYEFDIETMLMEDQGKAPNTFEEMKDSYINDEPRRILIATSSSQN